MVVNDCRRISVTSKRLKLNSALSKIQFFSLIKEIYSTRELRKNMFVSFSMIMLILDIYTLLIEFFLPKKIDFNYSIF